MNVSFSRCTELEDSSPLSSLPFYDGFVVNRPDLLSFSKNIFQQDLSVDSVLVAVLHIGQHLVHSLPLSWIEDRRIAAL